MHSVGTDDEDYYLMYWIIFAILRILDLFFVSHVVNFLSSLTFMNKVLGYLGLNMNEFWLLFKMIFLIFC